MSSKIATPAPKTSSPTPQLTKDKAALAASKASEKKENVALKTAATTLPGFKDEFVAAQKTVDQNYASQQKTLEKQISADERRAATPTAPATPKTVAKKLDAAKKGLTHDETALKGNEKKLGADQRSFAQLEKLDPGKDALYTSQAQRLETPIKAKIASGKKDISADKREVSSLTKQLKKLDAAKGGSGKFKGTGGFRPGPGTLKGEDTSHWVSTAGFDESVRGKEWTAMESSNGTSGVDPDFASRWADAGKLVKEGKMKLRIAYQFMSPGDGVSQAKHFLNTVGVHGKMQPGTRLCLDWEASALNDPQALHDAAGYIHKVTGVWPLVYTSGSEVSRAKAAVPQAPIWEAAWSAPDGQNGGDGNDNRNVAFFQYAGDVPFGGDRHDLDVFNGNLKALERFAGETA